MPTRRQPRTAAASLALFAFSASGLALFAVSASVHAQDIDTIRLAPPGSEGGVVGLGLAAGPRFMGSDSNRVRVLPVLGYQWANGWFASTLHGVGVNLSGAPDLQYGPRLTLDPGRREGASSELRGLGDVRPSLEGGGFVNYRLGGGFGLNGSLRAGAGEDHRGVRLDLGGSYGLDLAPGLRLRLGAAATLSNAAYAQTRFGVTDTQSANSGYAVYSPKGGLQDVHASAGLNYSLSPRVTLSTTLTATRLTGDARDSPLVRKTSTVNGQLGLAYGF